MTRTRTTGAIAGFIFVTFGLGTCGHAVTQATGGDDVPAQADDGTEHTVR